MSVMNKLKDKDKKPNAELLQIAHEAGVAVTERDGALLRQPETTADNEECEAARERLLLKLDSYEAKKRSSFSQTLAFISVALSIVSALVSIYASLLKS
jgi:hypothetical protein